MLTVAEVYAAAAAIPPRYRLLVLSAAFTTLRFGELASLRRRGIDTVGRVVLVQPAQTEMQNGRLFDKTPKSAAGVRPVAFPDEILADVIEHLERFAGAGRDGHVFLRPQDGLSGSTPGGNATPRHGTAPLVSAATSPTPA